MAGMFAPATYWPLIQKAGVALTPSFVPKSMCSLRRAHPPFRRRRPPLSPGPYFPLITSSRACALVRRAQHIARVGLGVLVNGQREEKDIQGHVVPSFEERGCLPAVRTIRIRELDDLVSPVADLDRLVQRQILQFRGGEPGPLLGGDVPAVFGPDLAEHEQALFGIEIDDVRACLYLIESGDLGAADLPCLYAGECLRQNLTGLSLALRGKA